MVLGVCAFLWTLWSSVAATNCPDLWIPYQGSCYRFGHKHLSFFEAQHYCEQHNGHLVHIESTSEIGFLKEFMDHDKDTNWWIGLTDDDIEGQWVWYGTSVMPEVTDWHTGEPNNSGPGEDCAQYYIYNGGASWSWNDAACNLQNASPICELKGTDTLPVVG
ncbi:hypothetical protein ACF0H5_003561 [Mactra antiquata]